MLAFIGFEEGVVVIVPQVLVSGDGMLGNMLGQDGCWFYCGRHVYLLLFLFGCMLGFDVFGW